jgi:hypothetical protein
MVNVAVCLHYTYIEHLSILVTLIVLAVLPGLLARKSIQRERHPHPFGLPNPHVVNPSGRGLDGVFRVLSPALGSGHF